MKTDTYRPIDDIELEISSTEYVIQSLMGHLERLHNERELSLDITFQKNINPRDALVEPRAKRPYVRKWERIEAAEREKLEAESTQSV